MTEYTLTIRVKVNVEEDNQAEAIGKAIANRIKHNYNLNAMLETTFKPVADGIKLVYHYVEELNNL